MIKWWDFISRHQQHHWETEGSSTMCRTDCVTCADGVDRPCVRHAAAVNDSFITISFTIQASEEMFLSDNSHRVQRRSTTTTVHTLVLLVLSLQWDKVLSVICCKYNLSEDSMFLTRNDSLLVQTVVTFTKNDATKLYIKFSLKLGAQTYHHQVMILLFFAFTPQKEALWS